eukprot:Rmarinus@m.26624
MCLGIQQYYCCMHRFSRALATFGRTMSSTYDYDLFVIGAGSGGVRSARVSAQYGKKVAIAEKGDFGGTCVNVGCVPKKLFYYSSHFSHDFEDSKSYGWEFDQKPAFNWNTLRDNKNKEISRLNGIYTGILERNGVTVFRGAAKFKDAHTIDVGGETVTFDKALIATGSWPYIPAFPGHEHAVTSNEMFHLDNLPKRLIVVGGGYIAVEFACIMKGLGCDVSLMYRGPLFLRGFDHDVRQFLANQMKGQGIDLCFNSNIASITKESDGSLTCTLEDGRTCTSDMVMYATGRVPLSGEIGVADIGVKMNDKGAIAVNEYSQTSVENIYAVGDVTDRVNLTPVAIAEGHCFADTVFGGKDRKPDHELIPTAVFSQPTIGTCGLTEEQARAKYGKDNLLIFRADFRPLKHTLTERLERTFMKLIVERSSDKVVGVHLCDPHAGELIQTIGVAMKMGVTKAQFDATIGVHPTAAEELVTMRQPSKSTLDE